MLQDENLLPACKKRVSLALRLDTLVRTSSKAQADQSWIVSAAADLGVLSLVPEGFPLLHPIGCHVVAFAICLHWCT